MFSVRDKKNSIRVMVKTPPYLKLSKINVKDKVYELLIGAIKFVMICYYTGRFFEALVRVKFGESPVKIT